MSQIVAITGNSVEGTLAAEEQVDFASTWQEAIRRAIRSVDLLLEKLELSQDSAIRASENQFPVFVPLEFLARMQKRNPFDPLLTQVLATDHEQAVVAGFFDDPVGDLQVQVLPGLLKKYSGRALLIVGGACAIHCRYCFRRNFPYSDVPKSRSGWQAAIDSIARDSSLEEVILSGGDPLMVADSNLQWIVDQLNSVAHIRRIRIHTRMPVVIPQRVCPSLVEWIKSSRAAIYIVLHANHANEIDASVARAADKLRTSGATLLNQAVLLRGVNDTPDAQLELCTKLLDLQILPYYLHQLDRVSGTAHFEVSRQVGLEIIEYLRRKLPGYGVPQYVREQSGQPFKMPLL